MSSPEPTLINYGFMILSESLNKETDELPRLKGALSDIDWVGYEKLLGEEKLPEEYLTSIFSRVNLEQRKSIASKENLENIYHAPLALKIKDDFIFPMKLEEASKVKRLDLWKGFTDEYKSSFIEFGGDNAAFFECFYHLLRKWAWGIPCSFGEQGISLFEQWKSVAALVFATGDDWMSGPGSEFTLIGGDFPGIQDFVYTITSRGPR